MLKRSSAFVALANLGYISDIIIVIINCYYYLVYTLLMYTNKADSI